MALYGMKDRSQQPTTKIHKDDESVVLRWSGHHCPLDADGPKLFIDDLDHGEEPLFEFIGGVYHNNEAQPHEQMMHEHIHSLPPDEEKKEDYRLQPYRIHCTACYFRDLPYPPLPALRRRHRQQNNDDNTEEEYDRCYRLYTDIIFGRAEGLPHQEAVQELKRIHSFLEMVNWCWEESQPFPPLPLEYGYPSMRFREPLLQPREPHCHRHHYQHEQHVFVDDVDVSENDTTPLCLQPSNAVARQLFRGSEEEQDQNDNFSKQHQHQQTTIRAGTPHEHQGADELVLKTQETIKHAATQHIPCCRRDHQAQCDILYQQTTIVEKRQKLLVPEHEHSIDDCSEGQQQARDDMSLDMRFEALLKCSSSYKRTFYEPPLDVKHPRASLGAFLQKPIGKKAMPVVKKAGRTKAPPPLPSLWQRVARSRSKPKDTSQQLEQEVDASVVDGQKPIRNEQPECGQQSSDKLEHIQSCQRNLRLCSTPDDAFLRNVLSGCDDGELDQLFAELKDSMEEDHKLDSV